MHPKYLSIKEFSYNLPDNQIAKHPLLKRDESRLLVYKNGAIKENLYKNLITELPSNTLLIFNNTKVVEARLLFQKSTGGIIEIFCLEPDEQYADISSAMLQKGKVLWKCLVGSAKKWKENSLVTRIQNDSLNFELIAKKIERKNVYFLIEFEWNDTSVTFAEVLHYAGLLPLPPYLHRALEEKDKETYQTIYAKHDGSVAAPTAGLHFTEQLFNELKKKNIEYQFVTLHVGAGTFKPVKSETMQDHDMHAEYIDVRIELIEDLLNNLNHTIVAVGTTSLRTIESLYWLGVKISQELKSNYKLSSLDGISVHQWDPYEEGFKKITAKESLQLLLQWMKENCMERLMTKTQIIIAPEYEFKIAKGLITNFHQPQSTLLLIVAALIKNDWKKVYAHALENNFRFLSYGDGCLFWKKD
jgi:S-adenosylmethionine:tRNA ribosyltransferase-isomerase